jgi:hypothetical protein
MGLFDWLMGRKKEPYPQEWADETDDERSIRESRRKTAEAIKAAEKELHSQQLQFAMSAEGSMQRHTSDRQRRRNLKTLMQNGAHDAIKQEIERIETLKQLLATTDEIWEGIRQRRAEKQRR